MYIYQSFVYFVFASNWKSSINIKVRISIFPRECFKECSKAKLHHKKQFVHMRPRLSTIHRASHKEPSEDDAGSIKEMGLMTSATSMRCLQFLIFFSMLYIPQSHIIPNGRSSLWAWAYSSFALRLSSN